MNKTLRRAITALVLVALASTFPATAFAAPPEMGEAGAGGTFTNPCTGHLVSFETSGVQVVGTNFVILRGQGAGRDEETGETFNVLFELTGTTAPDASGSFTGHSVIVFTGASDTFVVHSVANVNFRPDEPVIVVMESVACAGPGPATF